MPPHSTSEGHAERSELRSVAEALATGPVDVMLGRLIPRLRREAKIPEIAGMSDFEIEDHLGCLARVVLRMLAYRAEPGMPERLMQDHVEVQAYLAGRHGASRFRSGWDRGAIVREFTIMRDELMRVIRDLAPLNPGVTGDAAQLLWALVEEAEGASIQGWEAEAGGTTEGPTL